MESWGWGVVCSEGLEGRGCSGLRRWLVDECWVDWDCV